jgi:hypothetical protein
MEDNIKRDLKGTGGEGADWSQVAPGRVRWQVLMNTVMNLHIP